MKKQSMLKLKTALAGMTVFAAVLAAPSSAPAQESGVEIWGRTCGRCHRVQPPNKYDARHWEAIIGHMALNARMTADEEDAVREFLMGAARRVASESPVEGPVEGARLAALDPGVVASLIHQSGGEEIYKTQCAACHGDEGKGDGPAAAVFNPKPINFTDAAVMSEMTDEQILASLKEGKGAMPPFSGTLKPEEIQTVLEFIRSLTEKDGSR